MMPVVGGELHRANVDHTRSRTQIIPIYVIGAGSDEIGEAVQSGGSGVALKNLRQRHSVSKSSGPGAAGQRPEFSRGLTRDSHGSDGTPRVRPWMP